MTPSVVIVAAARAAVGSFNGQFANTSAHVLGAAAIAGALGRSGLSPDEVDEVILGQVLTAGQGQNPARQAAMRAGLPKETTAWGINQVCGSGLRAVALGAQQIALGDARIVIAGGQENMLLAPHAAHLRTGRRMGELALVDTMVVDGLWDAFQDYHMESTAENMAAAWHVGRDEQDEFALRSQVRAGRAQQEGRFGEEIVPVPVKTKAGEQLVATDEHPRPETTLAALGKLRPAFATDGTVTASNASDINDGQPRSCS